MTRRKMQYSDYYPQVLKAMTSHGVLVGSYDASGKPNVMTIGWGSIGSIWGIPTWIVLIRPSRYTYQCVEHSGCFTVNVPTEAMGLACALAGSKSGRDTDKFAEAHLTAGKARNVLAPVVEECPIIYECQVVHSNDVLPAKLSDEIRSGAYVSGDFHRVYFGKILAAYADPQVADALPK